MAKYRTTEKIDFTKTVVVSFDLTCTKNDFYFGAGYEEGSSSSVIEHGNVIINGIGNIEKTDFRDDVIYNTDTNTMEVSVMDRDIIFSKNFIILNTESLNWDKIGNTISESEKDSLIVYEKTDNYETLTEDDDLIVIDDIVYKKNDEIDHINYVLAYQLCLYTK